MNQVLLDAAETALFEAEKVDPRVGGQFQENHLIPLMLYKGNLGIGRIRTMLNFFYGLKENEVSNFTVAGKVSREVEGASHLAGIHARYGVQRMALEQFASRVWHTKEVDSLLPDMRDYMRWLAGPWIERGHITRIDRWTTDSHGKNGRFWWRHKRSPRRRRKPKLELVATPEAYPYINERTAADTDLVVAIDAVVPRGLPQSLRADICQDMAVAVLSGDITLGNLMDSKEHFIKEVFRAQPVKYGALSLDAPAPWSEDGFTLGQHLRSPSLSVEDNFCSQCMSVIDDPTKSLCETCFDSWENSLVTKQVAADFVNPPPRRQHAAAQKKTRHDAWVEARRWEEDDDYGQQVDEDMAARVTEMPLLVEDPLEPGSMFDVAAIVRPDEQEALEEQRKRSPNKGKRRRVAKEKLAAELERRAYAGEPGILPHGLNHGSGKDTQHMDTAQKTYDDPEESGQELKASWDRQTRR